MWKENIEALIGMLKHKPEQSLTVKVGDNHFAVEPDEYGLRVGGFIAPVAPPTAPTLQVRTLTGFVDTFKARIDGFDEPQDSVAVHVVDHLTVALISLSADSFGQRHEFVRATCQEKNAFPFNEFSTPELFLLKLQSGFLPTDNIVQLQRLASSLTSENSVGTADDGLSQVVTVKAGTVTRQQVELPTRLHLLAYRTFREIDPTKGEFMVRLKGKAGELPSIALLEIDADKWKLTAIEQVAHWLRKHLPEGTTVIA